MKILITGANGLLGSELVSVLSREHDIIALIYRPVRNPIPGVEYRNINFTLEWDSNGFEDNVDVIFHLAQSSHFRDCPNSALNVFNVNVTSTAKLLDYAARSGVKQFFYFSSGGVYKKGDEALKESDEILACENLGYYLGSKVCGEALTWSYKEEFNVKIIRPFFIYGKTQRASMLIPRLVGKVRNGNPINISRDGGIRINPIHVADCALVLQRLLEINSCQTLNLAGPNTLSIKEISDIIGLKLGISPIYNVQDIKSLDLIGDSRLMNTIFPEDLQTSFSNGVDDFI